MKRVIQNDVKFYLISSVVLFLISGLLLLFEFVQISRITGDIGFVLLIISLIILIISVIKIHNNPIKKNNVNADVFVKLNKYNTSNSFYNFDLFLLNSNSKEFQIYTKSLSNVIKLSEVNSYTFIDCEKVVKQKGESIDFIPTDKKNRYIFMFSTSNIIEISYMLPCSKEAFYKMLQLFSIIDNDIIAQS